MCIQHKLCPCLCKNTSHYKICFHPSTMHQTVISFQGPTVSNYVLPCFYFCKKINYYLDLLHGFNGPDPLLHIDRKCFKV